MKKDELGGICSTNEDIRHVYRFLVTKAMGKLVLGDLGAIRRTVLK
jgi:hypothetical protein